MKYFFNKSKVEHFIYKKVFITNFPKLTYSVIPFYQQVFFILTFQVFYAIY